MKKFSMFVGTEVEPSNEYPVPARVTGVQSVRLMSPPDYELWQCITLLDAGATIAWGADHGDEGVYVVSGALEVGGQVCGPGGAVIVESGAPAEVRATAPSHVVHSGSWSPTPPTDGSFGPPSPLGHGVHIVGPGGWFESGTHEGVHATWFADSTCPTCRISLFTVVNQKPGRKGGRAHIHTADEIIHVLEGSMCFGSYELGPDTSICIPANVRYAQWAGENGCTFLNFRRDTSEQLYFDEGSEPMMIPEGGLARGGREVGDVVHFVSA